MKMQLTSENIIPEIQEAQRTSLMHFRKSALVINCNVMHWFLHYLVDR